MPADSKLSPAYWRQRLFKNTYTYRGRRFATRNWCVKIQHRGIRQTCSLGGSTPKMAAAEACRLYRRLLKEGWPPKRMPNPHTPPSRSEESVEHPALAPNPATAAYWAQRLVHRQYTMALRPGVLGELSARIEHNGTAFYFPLRTAAPDRAAARAMRIRNAIAAKGWAAATRRFPRELTIAFHWLGRPLAWTYTTIHTRQTAPQVRAAGFRADEARVRSVGVIEPDAGVRNALGWCLNHMETFRGAAFFENPAVALRALRQRPVDILLVTAAMAGESAGTNPSELAREIPGPTVVVFSFYEDSEELFRSTPGGATNYFLQRTPSNGFLAPIASAFQSKSPGADEISHSIWSYFQNLLVEPPPGDARRAPSRLTQREDSVLALLGKGARDKDIASRLGISIHTVHEHVRNIFEKLGVHNRTEAVVKFLQK